MAVKAWSRVGRTRPHDGGRRGPRNDCFGTGQACVRRCPASVVWILSGTI